MKDRLLGLTASSTKIVGGWASLSTVEVWLKGAVAAIVGAAFPPLIQVLEGGSFHINWTTEGTLAAGALALYIFNQVIRPVQQITTFKKSK